MKMPAFTNYSRLLNSAWLWPAILSASALAIAAIFFTDSQFALRSLLALWFLLVCPGMAVVQIFDVQDPLLEWVLSSALSISLAGIISTIQIYTGTWSPAVALWILIGITLAGVLIQSMLNLKLISWPVSQASIAVTREARE